MLFCWLVLAPGAAAQQRFSVESQGGITLPASRLAHLTSAGPNVGLTLAYHVRPSLTLSLVGDVDFLNGERLESATRAPDMRLWHYGLGLEKQLRPAGVRRLAVAANLGAGATTFASDEFAAGSANPRDFKHTYFTTSGGLRVGYTVSGKVTTFVGGRAYWMNTDKEDTAALAALDPDRVKAFDSAWTVPVVAGINVKL
jgi:hypothetical protein